jgi:hypothetical protein
MERHINRFNGGMNGDLDTQQMRGDTYLYSLNGKVIFNADNGTYSWDNTKGNSFAFELKSDYNTPASGNYYPIDGVELNGKLVVFSVNENTGNSEIGVVNQNQYGAYNYQTIFNDKYDPQGGKLRFSRQWQIIAHGLVESKSKESVYWNDDKNEPRTINILYVDKVQLIGSPPVYNDPAWSVTGFAQSIDLTWGLIKYKNTKLNNGGALTTARYQYCYRYIDASGFISTFSPPCNFITLALNTPDNAEASLNKWTGYNLRDTGAATSKSIEIQLKHLDARFKYVEVCAIQWYTDSAFNKAVVFGQYEIPSNGILDIEHKNMIGTEVTIDKLLLQYLSIKAAKTQAIKDNSYVMGNIVELPRIEIKDTDTYELSRDVEVKPKLRLMKSDTTNQGIDFPVTNQTPTASSAVKKRLFGTIDEVYEINNEYINYKGTQIEHLFGGKMRGERYRYGLVVFDRKGQRSYVNYLCDFKFPEQYAHTSTTNNSGVKFTLDGSFSIPYNGDIYTLTEQWGAGSTNVVCEGDGGGRPPVLQGNDFSLKIMGVEFSNIRIPHNILFDENGNLNVSGFSVVRCDLPRSITAQGLLLNTIRDERHDDLKGVAAILGFGLDMYPPNGGYGSDVYIARAPSLHGNGDDAGIGTKWGDGGGFKVVRPLPSEYNWFGGDSDFHADSGKTFCPDRFGLKRQWDYPSSIAQYAASYGNSSNPYEGCLLKAVSDVTPTSYPMRVPFITKKNVFTFECPEYMFDQTVIGDTLLGANVELVGICIKAGGSNWITRPPLAGMSIGSGNTEYRPNIIYGKFYNSVLPTSSSIYNNLNGAGTGMSGGTNSTGLGTSETIRLLWKEAGAYDMGDGYSWDEYSGLHHYGSDDRRYMAYQCASARSHKHTVGFVLNDGNIKSTSLRNFTGGGSGGDDSNNDKKLYYIANVRTNNADWTPNKTEIEQSTYKNIGHFVPINKMLLATIGVTPTNGVDAVFDNVEVWGGDTYLDFYTYCRLEGQYSGVNNHKEADVDYFRYETPSTLGSNSHEIFPDYSIGLSFPCEVRPNLSMRAGDEFAKVGSKPMSTFAGDTSGLDDGIYIGKADLSDAKFEDFLVNKSFLAKDADTFNAQDSLLQSNENDFPTKAVSSEVKIYGEFDDSFRKIPVNNFIFANGIYGEITQIEELFDRIYVIQRTGFGYLPFNEKATISSSVGSGVGLGTARGFGQVEYISNKYGSQHQWGIVNTGKAIYAPDAYSGKAWKFSGAGFDLFSDRRGMHNFFSEKLKEYWNIIDQQNPANALRTYDNPCFWGGIAGAWDKEHNDVLFTFTKRRAVRQVGTEPPAYSTTFEGTRETIVYNENDDTFKEFVSDTPNLWTSFNGSLLGIGSQEENDNAPTGANAKLFYVRGTGARGVFYNRVYNSILRFAVNPNFPYSKVFDNVRLNVNREAVELVAGIPNAVSNAISSAKGTCSWQAPQTVTFDTDYRPEFREGYLVFPIMGLQADDRLRGKFMTLEYLIDNSGNKQVRITNNETQYRISQRT